MTYVYTHFFFKEMDFPPGFNKTSIFADETHYRHYLQFLCTFWSSVPDCTDKHKCKIASSACQNQICND